MRYEIKYKPAYSMLVVNLEQAETITDEAGAMTYMDPTIEPHTRKREKSLVSARCEIDATGTTKRRVFFGRPISGSLFEEVSLSPHKT
jgi:uncharacterized protein (AIM24 family)